jgi:hypothetical protein
MSATPSNLLNVILVGLPAIAIYMQILSSQRMQKYAEGGMKSRADWFADYHLARGSILFITAAGFVVVLHLLALEPPVIFPNNSIIRCMLVVAGYVELLLIGIALFFLLCSVIADASLKEGERTIWKALVSLWPLDGGSKTKSDRSDK